MALVGGDAVVLPELRETVRTGRPWLVAFAVGVALVLCYRTGAALGFGAMTTAWPFWPGNGFAFAVMARRPSREWPGCALAVFLGELLGGVSVGFALNPGIVLYALFDAGEATLAAALLVRLSGPEPDLRTFRAVGRLLGVALFAVTATALAAAAVATLRGTRFPARFLGKYWVGDALGFLVVAPAILRWLEPRRAPGQGRPRPARLWEALGLGALLVAVTLGGFLLAWPTGSYALVHAVMPVLAWCALRFGTSGGAAGLALVAAVGTVLTPLGHGPFAVLAARHDAAFASMQLFLAFVAISALLFGAAVAERRRAEELQRRAQSAAAASARMELVGRLASGVAHDFNNILTVVLAHAELAAMDLPKGAPVQSDLGSIRYAAVSGATMTRQLLALARSNVGEPHVIDLAHVVCEVELMLRRLAGEEVRLGVRVGPEPLPVLTDHVGLERVLFNLVSNARDALDPGGTIEVEAAGADRPPAASGLAPGKYAVLRVADTGRGMDALTLSRAFEQGFTTKEPGKGTGLGLSNVRQLVQQAGGWVGIESAAARGTVVSVWLPLAAAEPEQVAGDAPPEPGALAGRTFLVVDDDEAVRVGLMRLLMRCGARVHAAANGEDALAVAASHGAELDAVLADLVMPGANGARLLDRIAPSCPRARLVLMSGVEAAVDELAGAGAAYPILRKPFTPAELLARLR